jgi:hypothetical protein
MRISSVKYFIVFRVAWPNSGDRVIRVQCRHWKRSQQMNEATRRQILSDMGISVWRLRVATAEQAVPAAHEEHAAPGASAAGAVRPPMPAQALRSALEDAADSPGVAARRQAPAGQPAARPAAEPVALESLSVLAVAVSGAVLVLEGNPSKAELRLAMDVLASASGQWRARPSSRRFDWPPAVAADTLSADAAAGERALVAFVNKDVADHQARVLLATETVARRLPQAWSACSLVTMPELAVLGRDPQAKRALWQRLLELPP